MMIHRRRWKSGSFSTLQSLRAGGGRKTLPTVSSVADDGDCRDDDSDDDDDDDSDSETVLLPGSATITGQQSKRSSVFWLILTVIITGAGVVLTLEIIRTLSQQPERFGDTNNNNNRAAICAIQKGAVRYLDEWVQYHLLAVGFEDIYLYDNSDDFEIQAWYHQSLDDTSTTVSTASSSDRSNKLKQIIHIRHFPGTARQNEAYTHCIKQIQKARSHQWIAFIDIDEFVVLRDTQQYPTISDFLESLPPEYGGLAMNWVSFYWNHQMHYQDLPVTMRFQNRSDHATNRHIKTIARTHLVRKVSNPHFVDYLLLFRWWIHTYDTNGNIVEGPFNYELVDDQIVVYHYQCKSLEEYKERCSRGRATTSKEEWSSQLACQSDEHIMRKIGKFPESIKDDAPWQLLMEKVPGYANKYTNST
ncbi:unnamed protein product [Cylindrotheca closterium]|uniref:Glycosyltransferase family 92 protein n=1 Tax=Cylindrotheca closterium TaxID=2856 RepID=A0AAD2FXI8_9STRA|nr:unnamed protein product [Cylindrotheca closterium]